MSVGDGVVFGETLARHGVERLGVVRRAQGVLRVLQVTEVVLQVHPVRRPGDEHEGLAHGVSLLELDEHRGGARLHEPEVQVVPREGVAADLLHQHGTRLYAGDHARLGGLEVAYAVDAFHVAGDGDPEDGLPLVPGLPVDLHPAPGPVDVLPVVWHPGVHEDVRLPFGHAPEDLGHLLRALQLHVLVAEVLLQENPDKVGVRHVLVPSQVAERDLFQPAQTATGRQDDERHEHHADK